MNGKKCMRSAFTLRFRLVLLVAAELVASVLLAVFATNLLQQLLPARWHFPFILYLVVISLAVGIVVTVFLSRLFFDPIRKLRFAMSQVADGDFTVTLDTRTTTPEILDIYSGFNLMTRQLRATEILQTDFVSNVSHEFKTPITAIEGYATLLQGCEGLEPQQQEYVDKIMLSTRRLSSLTGSILLLSKLENQQIPNRQNRYRLDEQIRQCIVAMEEDWESKDISFDVEMINADYTGCQSLMYHVWTNLLSNAIKFSPRSGTISIRLDTCPEGFCARIRDDGPGIPDDAIDHIFQKFYQVDSSHKQEGNGLGLSLVDKILRLEKGSVVAENRPEGGCCFTVTLPNSH